MTTDTPKGRRNGELEIRALFIKVLTRISILSLVHGAVLFISSGRLDWVNGWIFIGLTVANAVIGSLIMIPRSPDLIRERMKMKRDAKGWDKVIVPIITMFLPIVTCIVAGLDERFDWSPPMSTAVVIMAIAIFILGQSVMLLAMASNRFFSKMVRIQKERGHTVITGGPYRYVRHPGYISVSIAWCGIPLILGSLWAYIPTAILICVMIIRTALEDRTLQNELEGYIEYSRQVRYRLLPGIW